MHVHFETLPRVALSDERLPGVLGAQPTGRAVTRLRMTACPLSFSGGMCCTTTTAAFRSSGNRASTVVTASRPPAEQAIAIIG